MSKDKISSQEMVDQIAARLSVSKRVAEEFLKSLFAEIEEALLKGESVKIKNLGTFKMQWNEPRKSVNVQTGEVFTIEGYNKVTFTPDTELKEAVNEPYSHLEPVELDGQDIPSFEIEKPVINTPEPLRNLNEQATEIKDILSEINALSAPKDSNQNKTGKDVEIDIPDYDIILIDEEEIAPEKVEEIHTEEPENYSTTETWITEEPEIIAVEQEPATESKPEEPLTETETSTTYNYRQETVSSAAATETTPEISNVPVVQTLVPIKKKKKGLRFLIWLIVILLLIGGGIYAAYFSSSCIRCWVQYDLLSEANRAKMNDYVDTFKGWFGVNKETLKTDSTETAETNKITLPDTVTNEGTVIESEPTQEIENQSNEPADSLEQVFKNRRNYTEFLGEEEITEGTRLTNISQHYYGKKEFWVYIYEANRDNIVHPDRITPGTIVQIPKLDPRLIDKKNPLCLQKAKELHDLYVGKK